MATPPKHIVVLMLENRSFDHMLGHLAHGGLEPVDSDDRNIMDVSRPDGEWCPAHFLTSDRDVTADPGHGFDDVVRQLTGDEPPLRPEAITNGGFAWNYARRLVERNQDPGLACDIMGCHSAEQVPVLSTLAREFVTCSRWFASVPSETWPNRLFAHGAQSEGLLKNVIKLYKHRTTFDALSDARRSWAVYAGDVPQAGAYVELGDLFKDRFNTIHEFFDDVEHGTLPSYSFLEPSHFIDVDSQHPTHSVHLGDELLRKVYSALASKPEIWESLLFLVTYDEHGGFFDRERPPAAVPPSPGMKAAEHGFGFDVLGVRVPAVVVSPFVEAGVVNDTVRDHSSIVRTVLDALGVDETLTDRDAAAESVLPLLTREEARAPVPLPPPPARAARAFAAERASTAVELDDLQRSLVELTHLLDEHRAPPPRRLAPLPTVGPVSEPVASRADVEELVAHFQREHMGSRDARLRRPSS
ncbi:MAG TPA: alkaline phosphatase family protein [Thermoleophilaceae bacterium]|nr:alkaline phosphatase family protein [Thermoleophilaceae bacterium]